jgi:hypothetical protein
MRAERAGPGPNTPEGRGFFQLLTEQIKEAAPLLTFATVLLGAGMMVSRGSLATRWSSFWKRRLTLRGPVVQVEAIKKDQELVKELVKKDQELVKKDQELAKKDQESLRVKLEAELDGLKKDEALNNLQVRSELERRLLDFLTSTGSKEMRSRIMKELSGR